jgi:hypothetical protein
MRKFVKVTYSSPGYHKWPDAPERRAYLGQVHRHMFIVTVEIEVDQADRQLEFHDLQAFVQTCHKDVIAPSPIASESIMNRSCETMAMLIFEQVHHRYGWTRSVRVEVSEDGENSGIVTWKAGPVQHSTTYRG